MTMYNIANTMGGVMPPIDLSIDDKTLQQRDISSIDPASIYEQLNWNDDYIAEYEHASRDNKDKSTLDPLELLKYASLNVQPIYDFNTSNETAKYMQKVLASLGIANSFFHLLLFDRDLVGVDPYSEEVQQNPVLMKKIMHEVKINPYYYFRELFRIKSESGRYVKFRFDIGNLSSMFLHLQGFNTYKEQPRQTGKTVYDLAMLAYMFNFRCSNTEIGLYHFSDTDVKKSLKKIIEYMSSLPKYLQLFKVTYAVDKTTGNEVAKESNNTAKSPLSIRNESLGNVITTKTCGQNKDTADRAGRGATQAIQYWDEVGFVAHIRTALGSAIPAFNTASLNAASGGNPYYISLTSTPPDASREHGLYLYNKFKINATHFEPYMFDKTYDELKMLMKTNGDTDFFFLTYQYYELGFDESWAITQRRLLDPTEYARDILLNWIRDYSHSPYKKVDLDQIEAMVRKTKCELMTIEEFYQIKFYEYGGMTPDVAREYFKDKPIIIGVDVSAGLGGNRDKSTMCGICPETGEVIFTFRSNEANTRVFSNLLYKVVKDFFHEAILVIERNSYGQGVIDNLSATDIERNLFYTNMTKSQMANKVKANKKGNYMYGIFNQSEVRETLYGMISTDIVSLKKRVIKSIDIFEELSTVVLHNGRYDHEDGAHDDLLIAMLFAFYALLYDPNMEKNFNIKRPTLVSDNEYTLLEFEDAFRKKIRTKKDVLDDVVAKGKGYNTFDDIVKLADKSLELNHSSEGDNLRGKTNKPIDLVEDFFDELAREYTQDVYAVDKNSGAVKQNIKYEDLGFNNKPNLNQNMQFNQNNRPIKKGAVNDMTSHILGDDFSPF